MEKIPKNSKKALLSLYLLYLYHENPEGYGLPAPLPTHMTPVSIAIAIYLHTCVLSTIETIQNENHLR